MKFLKAVLASTLLAGLLAVSVNAQGVSVADYNITLKGENAVVEREIIKFVSEKDESLARIYAGMLKSGAASIVLTPTQLVDLTVCGAPESDKAEIWASMAGEAYKVEYHKNGVITMDELSEPVMEE